MATTHPSMEPPPQWPPEVASQYTPVRRLGKGGFASVVLAQHKTKGFYAALKVVGHQQLSKQEYGYAHREIDILTELSHPNIMKVLEFWEPKGGCVVMALSYAGGPTLEQLLQSGGAVSITFGRVVMAQLMDALAHLHSRAVIHRDIKPDNVVITGASASQEEIWNDTTSTAEDTYTQERSWQEWKELCQKWHVTLVDFGFARALTPEDVEKEQVAVRQASASDAQASSHSRSGTSSKHKLDRSVSRILTRKMSALGNRFYAAPEVMHGVQSLHNPSNSFHMGITKSGHRKYDITQTISSHVANYGMLADAFSLGNTLQYMMTGVPPHQDVNEIINLHNSPLAVFFRFLAQHVCASSSGDGKNQKYHYRGWKDMPPEMMRLIRGLNHPSVAQRISIRASRRYPIIESVLDDPAADPLNKAVHHQLDFLPCTQKTWRETAKPEEQPEDEQVLGAGAGEGTERTHPVDQGSAEDPVALELE